MAADTKKYIPESARSSSNFDRQSQQADRSHSIDATTSNTNNTQAHLLRVPVEVRLQIYRYLDLKQQRLDVIRVYGNRLRMRSDLLTPTLTHVCSQLRMEILLSTRHFFCFDSIYTATRFAIEVEPLIVSQITHFRVRQEMPAWITRHCTSWIGGTSLLYHKTLKLLAILYPNLEAFTICKTGCLVPDGGLNSLVEDYNRRAEGRTHLSYTICWREELTQEQMWRFSLEQDFGEQIIFTYKRLWPEMICFEASSTENDECVRQGPSPSGTTDLSLWKSRTDQALEQRIRLLRAAGLPTYLASF